MLTVCECVFKSKRKQSPKLRRKITYFCFKILNISEINVIVINVATKPKRGEPWKGEGAVSQRFK